MNYILPSTAKKDIEKQYKKLSIDNQTQCVVKEKSKKKNGFKHQNIPYAISTVCSDHSSKKLKPINSVEGVNSERSTSSDIDDTDLFYFDLTGNKYSMPFDHGKNSKYNGFASSPLEGDNLVTNKIRKITNKRPSDHMNSIKNGILIDIRDSDCEMTINSNQYSPNKRKHEMKKQKQKKSRDTPQLSTSSLNGSNQLLVDSSYQYSPKKVQKNNSEKKMRKTKGDFYTKKDINNEQKVEKNNFSDEIDIEGSEFNTSKSRHATKNQNKEIEEGNNLPQLTTSRVNQDDKIIAENSNPYFCEKSKKKHKVKKSKTKSQETIIKETSDFEKTFMETLLEYYQTQSTPLQSEDEDYSQNESEVKYKTKNSNHSNDFHVSVMKRKEDSKHLEKKHKRQRSNSGDCLNVSCSDENMVFEDGNCGQTSKKESKKRTSASSFQQTSISEKEIYTTDDVDCSKYSIIKNESASKKKKKEIVTESNSKEYNSITDTSAIEETGNVNMKNGEESFLQGSYDEQSLEEYTRENHKKKKHKAKCRGSIDSKNKSEMSSLYDVSTTEDSVTIGKKKRCSEKSGNLGKTINTDHSICKSTGDIYSKNQLEVESSASELDISYPSVAKMKRHKDNNLVHHISHEKNQNEVGVNISFQEFNENIITCPANEEKNIGNKVSENESMIESDEYEPNVKNKFNGKRKKENNSVKDNAEPGAEQEPQENSYTELKTKKKKKQRANVSLDDISIVDKEISTNMKNVSPEPDSFEDYNSKQVKKKLKKLVSYEKNSDNELDKTLKNELDISYNDLNDLNISANISSDSSEEIEIGNIKKINKNIESNLDSEDYGAEVLKNLNINIPFAIPPLHIHLERPSKPSVNEINACKYFEMKVGAYSREEDKTIKNNWKRFCKEHHLNIEPTAFFKFPPKMAKEEKLKFLQYISHGLENRSPHRVYSRFKTLFGNLVKKTGRFTEEEDNQILEFMEEMGSSKAPFTDLAKLLNRTSNSIERRYKRLHDKEKIIWTPSKAEELINRMLKVTKLEKPDQLKDIKLRAKQWRKISKKMGGISVIKLQRAWNITIYPRLFATGNLGLIKKQLLETLDERQETDWRQVNWKEISKKFPGLSPEKLYMMFKKLVIFNVPKYLQTDIQKCIECLKAKKIATTHKFIKYVYKNGNLTYESDNEDHSKKKKKLDDTAQQL